MDTGFEPRTGKRTSSCRSGMQALMRWAKRIGDIGRSGERYRPELHYMRGPGPKSRGKPARGSETA